MSSSRFLTLTQDHARQLAERFASPLYIIDEPGLLQRFDDFKAIAEAMYPKSVVGISYKTNPLQGMLYRLHQRGAYAEVVSGEEYAIAEQLGVPGEKIIFNGPMKSDAELEHAIINQSTIHCDHLGEVHRIAALTADKKLPTKIGLRLALSSLGTHWNRFGFSDLADAVNSIKQSPYLSLKGLHCHIGTNIRDIGQYAQMAKALGDVISQLKRSHGIQLEWLDVGGGLAGISPRIDEHRIEPHPLPDLNDYLAAIIEPLKAVLEADDITLYFEPGRTLFEPFAALMTRVVGHRDADGQPGLICDAGFNFMATAYVYNHPLHCLNKTSHFTSTSNGGSKDLARKNVSQLTHIYGPTCNQVDQLHQPVPIPAMDNGDFLLFYGVGAYCMSFAYSFIRYRPGVIAWRGDLDASWLRMPDSLEHANRLECVPDEVI